MTTKTTTSIGEKEQQGYCKSLKIKEIPMKENIKLIYTCATVYACIEENTMRHLNRGCFNLEAKGTKKQSCRVLHSPQAIQKFKHYRVLEITMCPTAV
jgi:hypothetical protein